MNGQVFETMMNGKMDRWQFWSCSIEGCSRPSAIDAGQCSWCRRHYCIQHARSNHHLCEEEPLDDATWAWNRAEELRALNGRVHNGELLRLASQLNHGARCWFHDEDPLFQGKIGGMHVHIRIAFETGSTWLARVLLEKYTSFSDDFTNHILTSEYATLKWLHGLDIPTPKVYGYGRRGDPANATGLAFLLIEELPGTPYLLTEPTTSEKEKVYSGLVEIMCKLKAHPFDRIGSLTIRDPTNAVAVGPIAGDRTGTLRDIGPFSDARHYYIGLCEAYLDLISTRQLFTGFCVNAYLIVRFMKDMAACGKWNPFDKFDNGPFYLKHMDDKGDHILVDDNFNITGLIDWTFARTVPLFEAFGPSLFTANMSDMCSGCVRMSEEDVRFSTNLRGRDQELAELWTCDDRVRRLVLGLGMGLDMSWMETLELWKGIISVLEHQAAIPNWEDWKDEHLAIYRDDRRLARLLSLSLDSGSAS